MYLLLVFNANMPLKTISSWSPVVREHSCLACYEAIIPAHIKMHRWREQMHWDTELDNLLVHLFRNLAWG